MSKLVQLTASKMELAILCPASFALPWNDYRTEWADQGHERHNAKETAIGAGDIPEILRDRWPGYEWRAEVKYAYDVSTGEGRYLGQGSDRDYGQLAPFEVAGTVDAEGKLGDRLVIVDWKSFEKVTKAEQNPQLKLLALAATRANHLEQAEIAIVPEVGHPDVAELDALDFDSFAEDVRDVLLEVAKAQHDYRNGLPVMFNTGRQCKYCPGFSDCPRQKELVQLVTTNAADNQVELLLPLNDDEGAAQAYEFAQRLRMLLKRIDAAVYARAAERPIPLPNGKMLGKVQAQGNEKLDGDVVYEVIKAKYGQSIADAAVIRSATKTRIKEALGFVGAKSVAAAEKEVLAEVRAKGGAKRDTKEAIEEYVPQLRAVNE